ncbi:MAG: SUF system NifU family Fe-S cluster assembly protein [Gammaproteobacteria bacterium]|nr:SUF system NifU family Fe-S cluster assembly protein [Gammaproteobacteria bacterium]
MSAVELHSPDELRDLYRELILDHSRSPRHFGKLPEATHRATGINPLCGDKLHLDLKVDANDRIEDIAFEGSGCAISVASASLLTDVVHGMQTEDAMQFFCAVTSRLTGNADPDIDVGKLQALDGVREFPSRIKCATLAWHALHSALADQSVTVSTE